MQINNKKPLFVTLIALILILCSSITIAVMLIIDKRDGLFYRDTNLAINFPTSCPAYITTKYQVEYYKVKLKVVFLSLIVVGVVSVILTVALLIIRRKELFNKSDNKNKSHTDNKQKQQNENKGNNNLNNYEKQKQPNLNQSSLIIPPLSTDRSVKQTLLAKDNNNKLLSKQQLDNNATKTISSIHGIQSITFPYTVSFFIPFVIIVLLLIVSVANHLSFYIQWKNCNGTYDISQIRLMVYFILQGVSIIFSLLVFCVNLYLRHNLCCKLQEEEQKRRKLQQQRLKRKQEELQMQGKKKQHDLNKLNNKQTEQNKATTKNLPGTSTSKINNNNTTQNSNIVKGKPLTNTNANTINNSPTINQNNKQQIINTTNNNHLTQNKHLTNKGKSSSSSSLSLQNLSQQQQSKNQVPNSTKSTLQVNNNKTVGPQQLQQIKQVESAYETNKSNQIVQNNNKNSVNYNQKSTNSKQQQTTKSDFSIQQKQIVSNKASNNHNQNYQIPSYENRVISKVFNKQNDLQQKDQITNSKKEGQLLLLNSSQNVNKKANPQQQQQQIQMVKLNNPKLLPIAQTQKINSPSNKQLIITPQKSTQKRKQLNFISSVYSIEQSSPFSSFTSNVVTSRVVNNSYQKQLNNHHHNILVKQSQHNKQSVDYYNDANYYQNDGNYYQIDDERYQTNRNHYPIMEREENQVFISNDPRYQHSGLRRQNLNDNSQRFSATNRKMQMKPQLPYQHRFVQSSRRSRTYSSRQEQQQQNGYNKNIHQYPIRNQPKKQQKLKHNKNNINNNSSQPYSYPSHPLVIPQKQQVYNPYYHQDESIINPILSGDEQSYKSGSSYYHNSIKKEINQSGDKVWDGRRDLRDRQSQERYTHVNNERFNNYNRYQQQQRYYQTQLNNYNNSTIAISKNTTNAQNLNFNKNKSQSITQKNPPNIIIINQSTTQNNETKLQKKQKKLKKHIQQKLNNKKQQQQSFQQEQQLDRKVIQQSIKYLNQNNYNSVLNPVKEENKLLIKQQQKQQKQLQQRVLKQQFQVKRQAQLKQKQHNQLQQSSLQIINKGQQIMNHKNIDNLTTLSVPKQLQSSKASINSNKNTVKLRQKRQQSKQQLYQKQQKTQQINKNHQNYQNIFVKYNDLYEYKNKVLKKRRNSFDANINLQNYQPVTVKPTNSPKPNKSRVVSSSLPKREYLEPQFKANVILLTPEAIKDRKMSK